MLTNLGTGVEQVRRGVESSVEVGTATDLGPDFPYTSRAKKVLELAMSEAQELNHSFVGAEHLFLGVLGEQKGVGAQVLTRAGVSLDAARIETARMMRAHSQPPATSLSRRSGWFVTIPGTYILLPGLIGVALVAWLLSGPAVLAAIAAALVPFFLARRFRSIASAAFSVFVAAGLGGVVGAFLIGSGSIETKILAAVLAPLAVAPPIDVLLMLQWSDRHRRRAPAPP